MASNLDREVLLARIGINLVLTRVPGIFRALTSCAYSQRFSAPLGARISNYPNQIVQFDVERCIQYAKQVNPQIQIFKVSAVTGEGLGNWYGWLHSQSHRLHTSAEVHIPQVSPAL